MREKHREYRPDQGAEIPPRLSEIYMPAMPPLVHMEAVARWLGARRRRRALRQLLDLDGHLLRDIGVSRERVVEALRRPAQSRRADDGHCA